MRNAPRLVWVLTAVSKALAALDHGLAAFDRCASDRTNNTNHQERS